MNKQLNVRSIRHAHKTDPKREVQVLPARNIHWVHQYEHLRPSCTPPRNLMPLLHWILQSTPWPPAWQSTKQGPRPDLTRWYKITEIDQQTARTPGNPQKFQWWQSLITYRVINRPYFQTVNPLNSDPFNFNANSKVVNPVNRIILLYIGVLHLNEP